jgi:acyl carrier protein
VAHIQLILEIENEFGIVFEAEDVPGLISIREITEKIISLLD